MPMTNKITKRVKQDDLHKVNMRHRDLLDIDLDKIEIWATKWSVDSEYTYKLQLLAVYDGYAVARVYADIGRRYIGPRGSRFWKDENYKLRPILDDDQDEAKTRKQAEKAAIVRLQRHVLANIERERAEIERTRVEALPETKLSRVREEISEMEARLVDLRNEEAELLKTITKEGNHHETRTSPS